MKKRKNKVTENVPQRVDEAYTVQYGASISEFQREPSLSESFRESFENPTFILSSIVVVVAALRFLFDGATAELLGQSISFAHTDPLAYGSLLTPVLAAHSFIRAKAKHILGKKVDNVDESK